MEIAGETHNLKSLKKQKLWATRMIQLSSSVKIQKFDRDRRRRGRAIWIASSF